jgi:hypothetical protein
MRASEFIKENATAGASSAGGIASVAGGLSHLGTVSRMGGNLLTGKYTNAATPNTPRPKKRKKSVK